MDFKKSELSFLNLYSLCINNKQKTGDKIQIKSCVDKNNVRFSQCNDESILITDINKVCEKDFTINISTSKLSQLFHYVNDESIISIEENFILIDNKSKYEFEKDDFELSLIDKYTKILNEVEPNQKFFYNDLDKMTPLKYYMGDDGLDTIAFIKGYFVSSDLIVTGSIKSENKLDEIFYFSKLCQNIFNQLRMNEVELRIWNKEFFYSFNAGNTIVIIPMKEYVLPNIFEEKHLVAYDHKYKAKINRKEFLNRLQRINIFTQSNSDPRVFITFKNNELVIENKDSEYVFESIACETDTQLLNHYVILSTKYLINILNSLSEDIIIMKSSPDFKSKTVVLSNEDASKFFIHCLYKYE